MDENGKTIERFDAPPSWLWHGRTLRGTLFFIPRPLGRGTALGAYHAAREPVCRRTG